MEEMQFDFFLKGYEQGIQYYNDYMNRIWNRFNIMLTLNAALFGLFLTQGISDRPILPLQVLMFVVPGIVVSLLMFWIGFQDYQIIHSQRKQITRLKKTIFGKLNLVSFTITKGCTTELAKDKRLTLKKKLRQGMLQKLSELENQEFLSEKEFSHTLELKIGENLNSKLGHLIKEYAEFESIPILFHPFSHRKVSRLRKLVSLTALPATTGSILVTIWIVILIACLKYPNLVF